jgi:hypothetical protein
VFETSSSEGVPSAHNDAWSVCLALGLVALVVCALLPAGTVRGIAYPVFGACAAAAILLGIRLNGPVFALSWYATLAGAVMFVVGDAVRAGYEIVPSVESSFPSLADVAALGGRVAVAAGLALLVRARMKERGLSALVDATIVAVGLGVVAWLYLIEPHAPGHSVSLLERLVPVSYPLVDEFSLAILARLVLGSGARPVPLSHRSGVRPGSVARDAGPGRRGGDRGAADPAAQSRLRTGPGLLFLQAAAASGDGGADL